MSLIRRTQLKQLATGSNVQAAHQITLTASRRPSPPRRICRIILCFILALFISHFVAFRMADYMDFADFSSCSMVEECDAFGKVSNATHVIRSLVYIMNPEVAGADNIYNSNACPDLDLLDKTVMETVGIKAYDKFQTSLDIQSFCARIGMKAYLGIRLEVHKPITKGDYDRIESELSSRVRPFLLPTNLDRHDQSEHESQHNDI